MEVDDILEQVDILEYISQYCDFEEKNGEYWALSPFKEEKTPSFSVNTEKQRFYDFSSGAGGKLQGICGRDTRSNGKEIVITNGFVKKTQKMSRAKM